MGASLLSTRWLNHKVHACVHEFITQNSGPRAVRPFFFFILSHEEVEASVDVEDLVDDDGDRGG